MAVGVAFGPTAWAHADGGVTTSARPGHLAPADHAASPTPTASSSSEAPLAGRQAGEGKARPGRSLGPMKVSGSETAEPEAAEPDTAVDETGADELPPDPDPVGVPVFTPPPGAFPEPGEAARQRQRQALDEPALRHVRDASLGSGIALVGLGLAFLAFRMRRAN